MREALHALLLVFCFVHADDILKALSILPFLLPDARSKVDPDKFIVFSPVSLNTQSMYMFIVV